jgi:ABC-2 type transport system permease protein
MRNTLVVAKWEYLERIKSKMFLISLLAFPIIIMAFAFLPSLLASRTEDTQKKVGLIDPYGVLAQELSTRLESRYELPDGSPNYLVRLIEEPTADIETLRMIGNTLVFSEEIIGYIYIPPDIYESNQAEYYSTNVGNVRDHTRFSQTIQEIVTGIRLKERGLESSVVDDVLKNIGLRTIRISPSGEERESDFLEIFWSAYIFIVVMMMMIATSGQILIRSVVEEKTNRIIEILASSCSPTDLMAGKILGLSALTLTQIGFYVVLALGAVSYFDYDGVSFQSLGLLVPYFIFGYLFYAAIFVVVGSPLSSEQEAQQLTGWLVLLLMLPFVFAISAVMDPNAPIVRILSFIPFLTPSFMALRIPIMMPPAWEIGVTLGILILSTIFMMWLAGKIFRIAILSYGKRPSVREILMWVRTS